MCGRFSQFLGRNQGSAYLFRKLGMGQFVFPPRYNIAPTQYVPVIRQESGATPTMAELRWGLIAYWAKDTSMGARTINARAESITEKPAFRDAFKSRRCLVPVSGFYEWKRDAEQRGKIPHYFSAREEAELLVFAGLWERWSKGGEEITSFAIVTTEANGLMRPIHARMPAILAPDDWADWLDPGFSDHAHLKALLRPAPDSWLLYREVGTHVNNARNEGEKCIEKANSTAAPRLLEW